VNNLKPTVQIFEKIAFSTYKNGVFYFLHLFQIWTGSARRRCLIGNVFQNTTVPLKLFIQILLWLKKCLTNVYVWSN